MKNIMLVLLIGISLMVIGLIIWLKPNSDQSAVSDTMAQVSPAAGSPNDSFATNPTTTASNSVMPLFQTGLEQLPASLTGTEVDGEILIDENKNLYVTRRLRDLFDYFLATVGEESLSTIVQRVKAYIRHRTPEPAQSQAVALFDQYVAYRAALRDVPEAGGKLADQIDLDAIAAQKAAERRLRQQFFDTKTIQAFFGDDDAYDQYTLESLKIANNPQLSNAEKTQKTADLLEKLPEHLRDAMQAAGQYQNLEQQTAEWKARNGSAAELRQIRLNLVGIEATGRLEALDQDNDQWQQRVDAYLQEYNKINNNPQWSVEQKQLMVISLRRQQGFNEAEQLRLPAFEQMAAQKMQPPVSQSP